jgi:D-alanyl-D-alanine carboxypeptidase
MRRIIKWALLPLVGLSGFLLVRFGIASLTADPAAPLPAELAEISASGELPDLSPAHFNLPDDFQAEAAEVYDVSDAGKILAYRETQRWPLASLTKLMTAVIALEKIGKDQTVVVSQAAVETGGDKTLIAGEEFSVTDLIKAIMTVSSNSAAISLADSLAEGNFVRLMNQKATEIGLAETTYFEPAGLSMLNQSTAEDVVKLASYIRENHPEIFALSRQARQTILERKSGRRRTLTSINSFAGRADFLGGKTGYTDEAKGNLLSLFRTDNGEAFFVVLGAADRFAETEKLLKQINALGSD